jgi:hypothetical protein
MPCGRDEQDSALGMLITTSMPLMDIAGLIIDSNREITYNAVSIDRTHNIVTQYSIWT